MKLCRLCGVEKPLTAFYACPSTVDGRRGECSVCHRARVAARRLLKLDEVRAVDRVSGKARYFAKGGYAGRSADRAALRAKRPDMSTAHDAVKRAISIGVLVPWPVCAIPSCVETKVDGHHADYSRPLDVVWLCRAHHAQAHALCTHSNP